MARREGSELSVLGTTLRVIVPSDATGGAYSVVEQLDRPGGGSPPHLNSREDIVITAVEGIVEVRLPDGTVSLTQGQSIPVPRNTLHWTRNRGSVRSRTLYTFLPGGFEGFFVEVARLGTNPDLEQVAKIAAAYGQEIAPPEGEGVEGEGYGMTTEELKVIARRFFDDVWNRHDVNAIDRLFAHDFVDHYPSVPRTPDRDGFKQECRVYLTALPDTSVTIEDQIAEGDRVVSRVVFRGTHTGPFGPVPPTGRRVEATGCIILRIDGGLIAERWGNIDELGTRRQLGLVPPMPGDPSITSARS